MGAVSEWSLAVGPMVASLVRATERSSRGARIVENLRGTADVKMTTDEILALTRGDDGSR